MQFSTLYCKNFLENFCYDSLKVFQDRLAPITDPVPAFHTDNHNNRLSNTPIVALKIEHNTGYLLIIPRFVSTQDYFPMHYLSFCLLFWLADEKMLLVKSLLLFALVKISNQAPGNPGGTTQATKQRDQWNSDRLRLLYQDEKSKERAKKVSCGRYRYLASTGRCESCWGLCQGQNNEDECYFSCPLVYDEMYKQKELRDWQANSEQATRNNATISTIAVILGSLIVLAIIAVSLAVLIRKLRMANDQICIKHRGTPTPNFTLDSNISVDTLTDTMPLVQPAQVALSATSVNTPLSRTQAVQTQEVATELKEKHKLVKQGHAQKTESGAILASPGEDESKQTTYAKNHDNQQGPAELWAMLSKGPASGYTLASRHGCVKLPLKFTKI